MRISLHISIAMLMALLVIGSGCSKAQAKGQSIHEELIENDCYEFTESGRFVNIRTTDLCMMIAYPDKGEF